MLKVDPDAARQTALMKSGLLFVDHSNRTRIEFSGQDRQTFVHNLCTQSVKSLEPGAATDAFVCNVQGKLLGFVRLYAESNRLLLDTEPEQSERLMPHFQKYLIREDVQIVDLSRQRTVMTAIGQGANRLVDGQLADSVMHGPVTIGGVQCIARRIEVYDQPAFRLDCDPVDRTAFIDHLRSCGGEDALPGVVTASRIARGYPQYGQDFDEQNLPQELCHDEQAISFTKGCYLGQETVARIDAVGHVNRRLVRIVGTSDRELVAGHPVTWRDQTVGTLTSAAWCVNRQQACGLAIVRHVVAKGEPVRVQQTDAIVESIATEG